MGTAVQMAKAQAQTRAVSPPAEVYNAGRAAQGSVTHRQQGGNKRLLLLKDFHLSLSIYSKGWLGEQLPGTMSGGS